MAGTGNWNETLRDTGFEGEIGRDGGISEPSTGPSLWIIPELSILLLNIAGSGYEIDLATISYLEPAIFRGRIESSGIIHESGYVNLIGC